MWFVVQMTTENCRLLGSGGGSPGGWVMLWVHVTLNGIEVEPDKALHEAFQGDRHRFHYTLGYPVFKRILPEP